MGIRLFLRQRVLNHNLQFMSLFTSLGAGSIPLLASFGEVSGRHAYREETRNLKPKTLGQPCVLRRGPTGMKSGTGACEEESWPGRHPKAVEFRSKVGFWCFEGT